MLQSRLTHWATVAPDRLAVAVSGELTYAQLFARASSLIDWEPGTVVAIRFSNSIDFACAYVAGILSGATIAILDPAWPKLQLERVVSRLAPDVILTDPTEACWTGSSWQGTLRDLSPVAGSRPLRSLDETSRFLIAFTSGTTSEPKGYSRTRRSWEVSLLASELVLEAGEGIVTLAPGPMAHGVTLYALTEALFSGGTFISMPKFDPSQLVELAEAYGATRFVGVPTHYRRFPENGSWLRDMKTFVSGGEKLTPETARRVLVAAPDASIIEYYGASELSFVSYQRWVTGEQTLARTQFPEEETDVAGTIPFPGVEIEIRAVSGTSGFSKTRESGGSSEPGGSREQGGSRESGGSPEHDPGQDGVPDGECGVIWVRSELVIEGYLSEQNSGFRRDGDWVTVGDLGRMVGGRLEIVGREGGMVTVGGNNVYLSEVEEALVSHPALSSATVVAVPDAMKGQTLHAVLLADEAAALVKADLLSHLAQRLPKYKVPAHFHTVPAWPLVGSGKIDRKALQIRCSEGVDEWKPDEL